MSELADKADELGRRAANSDWVDGAARAGLVAFGLVHLLVGWLALQLAFGDNQGSASSSGAVRQLAKQPFGEVLVWLVALGMLLLVAWQLVEAAVGHRHHRGSIRVRKRIASAGKAVVYGYIGVTALLIAVGERLVGWGHRLHDSSPHERPGRSAACRSGRRRHHRHRRLPDLEGPDREVHRGPRREGPVRRYWHRLRVAREGRVHRQGDRHPHRRRALFGYAAITHEANKSGGLDQALTEVLDQPFGPGLLVAIALGIGCFGLFCFAQARHLSR